MIFSVFFYLEEERDLINRLRKPDPLILKFTRRSRAIRLISWAYRIEIEFKSYRPEDGTKFSSIDNTI